MRVQASCRQLQSRYFSLLLLHQNGGAQLQLVRRDVQKLGAAALAHKP
jgi:hypothetical protein